MSKSLDIIRSPAAERMIRSVTKDFYGKAYIGQWLFEVIGREYDEVVDWVEGLRDEIHPQTCTWSIGIWEWVYGFEPDESMTLQERRDRILNKIIRDAPINPASIEEAVAAITGCTVDVFEHTGPYRFRVEIDESGGSDYDLRAALMKVKQIKPSHLSFEFGRMMESGTGVFVGAGASKRVTHRRTANVAGDREYGLEAGVWLGSGASVYIKHRRDTNMPKGNEYEFGAGVRFGSGASVYIKHRRDANTPEVQPVTNFVTADGKYIVTADNMIFNARED